MSEFENYWKINCILVEFEQLKTYVKELENRIKELEKNDNEQRQTVLLQETKNS